MQQAQGQLFPGRDGSINDKAETRNRRFRIPQRSFMMTRVHDSIEESVHFLPQDGRPGT